MDAWGEPIADFGMGRAPLFDSSDPLFASLLAIKSGLHASDPTDRAVELISAVCDGDLVTVEAIARLNPELLLQAYPLANGAPALILAVAFDHPMVVELLLLNHGIDPDSTDECGPQYLALMWAVHLSNLPVAKILLDHRADPNYSPKDDGVNAALLAKPGTDVYNYFKTHNLVETKLEEEFEIGFADPVDDGLAHRIKMATISANLEEEEEEEVPPDTSDVPEYNYDRLIPEQFIKFTDSDIPSLLDFIFSLRLERLALQHTTHVPAAIVFQLVRFSHFKVNSTDLTEYLFECFITRLRSVTNTKSGVFNMAVLDDATGDIVLLSYWLLVTQFLHFYFARGRVYFAFPQFLQELVNLTQLLVATLSFSINARLQVLMGDCLLDFTSLVDVLLVLYAKDWNFFKHKKKHPSTYEDILEMLYPPTEAELMKPSPLKYVQVLGALDYVLRLHEVDLLLCFQTFSQVFYYINATLFNRLLTSSRYCSRAKAIQIRLNVSTLEDWLRSHNYSVEKPESRGGLKQWNSDLTNVLDESEIDDPASAKDPHSLAFYYHLLYHVGKTQLSPTIELLQWLQCMLALTDEESFIHTINQFDALNYYQLVKVASKLYRYEVDEPKLARPLLTLLKRLATEQGENQVARNHLHYMTQSTFLTKEVYIYLNPNHVFNVALPNLGEMVLRYGAGPSGDHVERAKRYQPLLTTELVDDVDEVLTKNKTDTNDTFDYSQEDFKGDELFKEMQPPLSLVHREWGDTNLNPW